MNPNNVKAGMVLSYSNILGTRYAKITKVDTFMGTTRAWGIWTSDLKKAKKNVPVYKEGNSYIPLETTKWELVDSYICNYGII